jgi:hypothetical protein
MLTILSGDGRHRAVVSEETDEGVTVAFFRLVYDDSRGLGPGEKKKITKWRYMRTSVIPQPFHVALDIATAIVEDG